MKSELSYPLPPGQYRREVKDLGFREAVFMGKNYGVSVKFRESWRTNAGWTIGLILNGEIVWCQGGKTLREAFAAFRRDALENRGAGWQLVGEPVDHEMIRAIYKKLCKRSFSPLHLPASL